MRTGADPRWTRGIALRIGVVAVLFAAGFAAVAARAVHLQILQGDHLSGLARDQYLRNFLQKPRRGIITDRSGAVLAGSAEAYSIFIDPAEFPDPRGPELARLSRLLEVDAKTVLKHMEHSGHFAWLKRRVSDSEAESVRKLSIPGVSFLKETRRYYPQRELAGQVLGVVGDGGEGLEGVEYALDDSLQGEQARAPSLRDARGRQLLGEAPAPERTLEGARVELAIDQGLELVAEQALDAAVKSARAASGMAVAVDPATGEILALANVPLLNPNTPRREALRNRAVLDTFEPGSTMKAFVLARALEEGVLRPRDALFCENGSWSVGGHVIHDHHGLGWVSPARVMAASSNICAAKVGMRLGRDRLQQALLAFGLGDHTQVGLTGEPRGQVPYPRAEISLANMSFGQGVTASALQVTLAMAALANGGTLMKPWLVRRVVDPSTGEVLSEAIPTPVRRVVSAATAAQVTRWLEGVVADADGTGKRARLESWSVAGKTGTAQKADPAGGYSADRHFSSFVGFAPATAPRIAIGVFIDEPKGEIYGGEVAAPVFREIAEYALKAEGVPPARGLALPGTLALDSPRPAAVREVQRSAAAEPALRTTRSEDGSQSVSVPSLEGLPARAALRLLEASDLAAEPRGSGRVTTQVPRPGEVVSRGSKVRLVLGPPL